MPDITIYLGYKNYSSWSLRAWLALEQTGAEYAERVFNLAEPGVRERVREFSPTARLPALRDGELMLWDSLAIGEHLAERFPRAGLWPADPAERAIARAVVAEMHSGFDALRAHMPMNIRRSSPGRGRAEGVREDIDRICDLWRTARERHGHGGEYLFGAFTLADCCFAPVVTRFTTYGVELDDVCRRYVDAVTAWPAMRRWTRDAAAETWTNPAYDL